jgi:hypothetical protein
VKCAEAVDCAECVECAEAVDCAECVECVECVEGIDCAESVECVEGIDCAESVECAEGVDCAERVEYAEEKMGLTTQPEDRVDDQRSTRTDLLVRATHCCLVMPTHQESVYRSIPIRQWKAREAAKD